MKQNIIILAVVALAIPGIVAATPVMEGGNTGGADSNTNVNTGSFTPVLDGGNTGGADSNTNVNTGSFVPVMDGGNTGGADSNSNANTGSFTPVMDGGNTGGADSNTNVNTGGFVPVMDGGNTGGADSIVNSSGGGNPPGSISPGTGGPTFSSGGSPGGGFVFGAQGGTILPDSCPLLTTYMKRGWNNDSVQVLKLQAFLRNSQELDVDMTGVFDQKTENAVRAFQTKNLSQIMGPWGANEASGMVYITTTKAINKITCNQPLTLTAEELAVINAYKARVEAGEASVQGTEIGSAGTSTVAVTPSKTGSGLTAAASDAKSVFAKFWAFVRGLFSK